MFVGRTLLMAAAMAALSAPAVHGATVIFNTETYDNGTGLGAVPTLLTVQNTGSEYGSVLRNSSNTADVLGGPDVKNSSRTWSLAELQSDFGLTVTADRFGVVFNLNESGSASGKELDLAGFTLRFYVYSNPFSASATRYFDAAYAPTTALTLTQPGGTGSAGHLFRVSFNGSFLDANNNLVSETVWFNNPNNRVGMLIESTAPIGRSDSGQETFYVAQASTPTPNPVPEPASAGLLIGLGGMLLGRRRR